MMRSMFSGVSGLRVHQTKMDVIANNIANVNTMGYKSSRVTFNEVFSQTISGAAGANPVTGKGGVNPMQVGLGVGVASIDKIMTTGAAQRTDRSLDLMIQGNGFFIVGDGSGTYFSRAGALDVDAAGNINNVGGMRVMGWNADEQGNIMKGPVQPLNVGGKKDNMPAIATTQIKFAGNINAKTDATVTRKISFYDSVGNLYTMSVQLERDTSFTDTLVGTVTAVSAWKVTLPTVLDSANAPAVAIYPNGDTTKPIYVSPASIAIANNTALLFDDSGNMVSVSKGGTSVQNDVALPITFTNILNPSVAGKDGLVPRAHIGNAQGVITVDFGATIQFGERSTDVKAEDVDGAAPGKLQSLSVGPDGKITGRYSNGKTRTLGQIPVARFQNPGGLEKVGDNLFVTTANSGQFDGVGEEVGADGSKVLGGVLEMSNVDLSAEFTEMITTQRGFQANSRIITTSDDMLQELVNLKR